MLLTEQARPSRVGSETCDTQLLQVRKGCAFDGCSVTVGVSESFPPDQGQATRVRDSVGQHRPTRPGSASAPFGPGVLVSSVSPSTAAQTHATQPFCPERAAALPQFRLPAPRVGDGSSGKRSGRSPAAA